MYVYAHMKVMLPLQNMKNDESYQHKQIACDTYVSLIVINAFVSVLCLFIIIYNLAYERF